MYVHTCIICIKTHSTESHGQGAFHHSWNATVLGSILTARNGKLSSGQYDENGWVFNVPRQCILEYYLFSALWTTLPDFNYFFTVQFLKGGNVWCTHSGNDALGSPSRSCTLEMWCTMDFHFWTRCAPATGQFVPGLSELFLYGRLYVCVCISAPKAVNN